MRRHVFTIIGHDGENQAGFDITGEKLHAILQEQLPIGVEPGLQWLGRPEEADVELENFLQNIKNNKKPNDHPQCQIIIYYLGHGTRSDENFHLGPTSESPLLAPIVSKAFASFENKLAFAPSVVLIVDACESWLAYTQGILNPLVPYIRQATSHTGGLSHMRDGKPIFSDCLSELLIEGVPEAGPDLYWPDIFDALKKRFPQEKAIQNLPDPNSNQLNNAVPISKNRVFDKEVMRGYLEFLIDKICQLPGYMQTGGQAEKQSIDFAKLRQPIFVTRGIQGNPISLPENFTTAQNSVPEFTDDNPNPEKIYDIPISDSVLRVQWSLSLLEDNPFLAIVGDPGCGKSWLARQAVLELSTRLLAELHNGAEPSDLLSRMPLLGMLRNISYQPEEKPESRLLKIVIRPTGEYFDRLIQSAILQEKGFVILDGLDEVSNKHANAVFAELCQFASTQTKRNLCILCREQVYRNIYDLHTSLAEPVVVRILPLHRLDVHNFIRAMLTIEVSETKAVFDSLLDRNLINNPLILTMACIAYRDGGPDSIKNFTNRSQILRRATTVILRNWPTLRTPSAESIPNSSVDNRFNHLATFAMGSLLKEFPVPESTYEALTESESVFDSGLLTINFYGELQFGHRALEEYMAAEGLLLKYSSDQDGLFQYIDVLSWREECHNVIFDVAALSNLSFRLISKFADKNRDSSSRHRLKLAAKLLASCPDTEVPVSLSTGIVASTLLIYCRSLDVEKDFFGKGLPANGSIAASWIGAVRDILRANPNVYANSIYELLSKHLPDSITSINDDSDYYFKASSDGSSERILAVVIKKACDVGSFDESSIRRRGVRAAAAILLTEPEHLAKLVIESIKLFELLAKEGNRGFFDIHWKLLTPSLLSKIGQSDPKLLVRNCLAPSTGWQLLSAFKEGDSPEVAQLLMQELEENMDPNSSDFTGLGYALQFLRQAGASAPALHFKILSFLEERVSCLYSMSWGRISLDTQPLAFSMNALQEFVWSLWNSEGQFEGDSKIELPMNRMLRFITHQDFRIRAVAGKCLRASRFEWKKFRLVYAFCTLDRLRFHQDNWGGVHYSVVEPRDNGRDWLPESVLPDTLYSTHDKLLWDAFPGDEALSFTESGDETNFDVGRDSDLLDPLYSANYNFTWDMFHGRESSVSEEITDETCAHDNYKTANQSASDFKAIEFDPNSFYLQGNELVTETLRQTFGKFVSSCSSEIRQELSRVDIACAVPIVYAAFNCIDFVARVNSTIQLGLLFGFDSQIHLLAYEQLFTFDSDYSRKEQLQKLADTVTWFTPKFLPERLQSFQKLYDQAKLSLAERIAESALAQNGDGDSLLVSVLQMPLSQTTHYRVVRRVWIDSPSVLARFQTFMVRHLALVCRRGLPSDSEFLEFLELAFPTDESVSERNKEMSDQGWMDNALRKLYKLDRFASIDPQQQKYANAICKAFIYHPKAITFAKLWRARLGSDKLGWTRETKAFVQFVSEVNQNSKGPSEYRGECHRLLDWVMKSNIVPQFNVLFTDDSDLLGWSADVTALLASMRDGYSPKSLVRVRKGLPLHEKRSWIFSSGSRFLRDTESLGYRYFVRRSLGMTFVDKLVSVVITWSPVLIVVALGCALNWQYPAYELLVEESKWVFGGLGVAIVLQSQASKFVNLSSNVAWSTVEILSSRHLKKFRT